ncbi:Formamidopyrimidine-DNA glycosylase [Methylobrevis pamukkalensis]|uniref:DNA-formamidopyrimidine glycosylase n=1 Tax=Methylobrevis pamukkalensis TaxID=1439726 RepID=A0A1E3H4P5_9HYPH|nr:Formamidopyrimidine-DNA glycosylase [Methylobrevis pamukkalensis]
MPELPEVETVRRGLQPVLEGAVITKVDQRRPDLRFPFPDDFAARITGRRVSALGRRAKYLVADLDDGVCLVMHLGMSGSFRFEGAQNGAPDPYYHAKPRAEIHDHVVFETDAGSRIVYNDPRRFGFMTLVPRAGIEAHPHFRGLGPEPTGNALSPDHLDRVFAGKIVSLKAALLDQKLIAGLATSMSARRCSAPACRRSPRQAPCPAPPRPPSARRWWPRSGR